MPWKETDVMQEKEKFIKEILKPEKPFKHICEEFGISEKTGYKWKGRFYAEGKKGLYEQSRAPDMRPNSLPEEAVIDLIKLKTAHPFWGGKKVRELYGRAHPERVIPSLSSVNRVLKRAELVKKRRVKPASNECKRLNRHIQPEEVNDVWAIDFKGWWKSSGEKCEPLTIRDLVSRKLLCVKLMETKSADAVRAVMTEVFRKYGLPKVIRSDNGVPFSSTNGMLSLTNLSAWWITLGIIPDRTDKGAPGQNGSLERMHADLAREIEGRISGGIRANQVVLDAWVEEYNSVRPNEAVGMKTPDELYEPSPRKYTGDFDEIEYPMGFQTRKVLGNGEITFGGIRIGIGYSLRGLNVGLKLSDQKNFDVFLADFLLGTLNLDSCCFFPLDILQ